MDSAADYCSYIPFITSKDLVTKVFPVAAKYSKMQPIVHRERLYTKHLTFPQSEMPNVKHQSLSDDPALPAMYLHPTFYCSHHSSHARQISLKKVKR